VNPKLKRSRPLVGTTQYAVRLARDIGEIRTAQALRFEIFNLELNEGLEASYITGRDVDPFDAVCDHLIVEHLPSQKIIGTYRLRTGQRAAKSLGYYSAQEFEFEVFEPLRRKRVEPGCACVHRDHRNPTVLGLLWKGIGGYCRQHGARHLLGCSSITSQNPAVGAAVYTRLCLNHLSPLPSRTRPRPFFDCPLSCLTQEEPHIPKILRAYLGLGATICGPPALDRSFKTIDFLTMLDLDALAPPARERFLS
jgi:putative hemolysin